MTRKKEDRASDPKKMNGWLCFMEGGKTLSYRWDPGLASNGASNGSSMSSAIPSQVRTLTLMENNAKCVITLAEDPEALSYEECELDDIISGPIRVGARLLLRGMKVHSLDETRMAAFREVRVIVIRDSSSDLELYFGYRDTGPVGTVEEGDNNVLYIEDERGLERARKQTKMSLRVTSIPRSLPLGHGGRP